MSYLVGVTFWTAIAIGMLMLILIHHILDASWSVVIRRQFEHGLSAFKWLALLFLPLVIPRLGKPDFVWPWMNLGHELHGGTRSAPICSIRRRPVSLIWNMFIGHDVGVFRRSGSGFLPGSVRPPSPRIRTATQVDLHESQDRRYRPADWCAHADLRRRSTG
jgi:hypothetical protein